MACYRKFTMDQQTDVLKTFNGMDSKNEQDLHLQRLMECFQIKRRRGQVEKRKASFKFFCLCNNDRVAVCRQAFINLHVITQKRVYRITTLLAQGLTPKDKRGFNVKSHCISGDICKQIHEHISSFPTKSTHYGQNEISYLDARLNVKIMYQLFKSVYPDSTVKYEFYLKYFHENFNLRFGRPQIDVCSSCEELETKLKNPHLSQTVKLTVKGELQVHKRRSKKFYNELRDTRELCKSDETVCGLVFDFMQNLPLPHIPVQEIFYMRQIWVYAFCVTNLKDNSSRMYVYSEGTAKKGANEVCSFLLDYITECVPETAKTLLLFSDSCPGQNKNHTLIRFCLGLVESGRFENIIQRFPIRGHSFLDCDRTFGLFKRSIKKADRIYHPMEYVELMANAKSNITVKVIRTEDIKDFNKWWPTLYKKTVLSAESYGRNVPRQQKQSFAPASFMEFKYLQNGSLQTSDFIGGLKRHTFQLKQPGIRPNPSNIFDALDIAYPEKKVPINKHKVDAVRNLLKYIPEENEDYRKFYEDYLTWPTTMEEN